MARFNLAHHVGCSLQSIYHASAHWRAIFI